MAYLPNGTTSKTELHFYKIRNTKQALRCGYAIRGNYDWIRLDVELGNGEEGYVFPRVTCVDTVLE